MQFTIIVELFLYVSKARAF